MTRYCVVGAGLSGAVIARQIADKGHNVLIVDEREHLGGNCHTSRDVETGIMIHNYGPHIFHTGCERVWEYVCQHAQMMPFQHRVKAEVRGKIFSFPINLLTINQFFGTNLRPDQARSFLAERVRSDISAPVSFEDQALAFVGPELYEAFFKGYTKKQWGIEPNRLPASILKRIPIRFDYNDSYFNHPHQAVPRDGYTAMVESIVRSSNIEVKLNFRHEDLIETFTHVFYTGPLDRFFSFSLGRLPYRTLDFEVLRAEGDFQGTAVLNFCDEEIPFTRTTEHKHFAPWENGTHRKTICFRETSREAQPDDQPYYPIRLVSQERLLADYVRMARQTSGVSFLGRLGTYRYLDMDVTIKEALEAADAVEEATTRHLPIPSFFCDPLAS